MYWGKKIFKGPIFLGKRNEKNSFLFIITRILRYYDIMYFRHIHIHSYNPFILSKIDTVILWNIFNIFPLKQNSFF